MTREWCTNSSGFPVRFEVEIMDESEQSFTLYRLPHATVPQASWTLDEPTLE